MRTHDAAERQEIYEKNQSLDLHDQLQVIDANTKKRTSDLTSVRRESLAEIRPRGKTEEDGYAKSFAESLRKKYLKITGWFLLGVLTIGAGVTIGWMTGGLGWIPGGLLCAFGARCLKKMGAEIKKTYDLIMTRRFNARAREDDLTMDDTIEHLDVEGLEENKALLDKLRQDQDSSLTARPASPSRKTSTALAAKGLDGSTGDRILRATHDDKKSLEPVVDDSCSVAGDFMRRRGSRKSVVPVAQLPLSGKSEEHTGSAGKIVRCASAPAGSRPPR